MKSNTYFKDSALAALKGNWGQAVAATLIYFLIACAVAGPGFYMYVSLAGLSDPDEILEAISPFFTYSSGSLLLEVFLLFDLPILYYIQSYHLYQYRYLFFFQHINPL